MNVYRKLLASLLLFGSLLAIGLPAAAKDAASQIKAEIARLQQLTKDLPGGDKDFAEVPNMLNATLKAATDAANSGQIYLALEKLGQAEDLLYGARRAASKAEVEKGGYPAFESQWKAVSLRLTALDKEAHARQWGQHHWLCGRWRKLRKAGRFPYWKAAMGLQLPLDRRMGCSM